MVVGPNELSDRGVYVEERRVGKMTSLTLAPAPRLYQENTLRTLARTWSAKDRDARIDDVRSTFYGWTTSPYNPVSQQEVERSGSFRLGDTGNFYRGESRLLSGSQVRALFSFRGSDKFRTSEICIRRSSSFNWIAALTPKALSRHVTVFRNSTLKEAEH